MRSLPDRIADTLTAGILGFGRSLIILAVTVIVGIAAMQAGLQWYARGALVLFPSATPAAGRSIDVAVMNATPPESAAIRRAVSALKYAVPPTAVTFSVVDQVECEDCRGAYVPANGLVLLEREVVEAGGAPLQNAVAHEIGHFVDFRYLKEAQRTRFKALRGIPTDLTWAAISEPWPDRPVEDFAEVFGTLASPAVVTPVATSYGQVRDSAELEDLLASAGIRFDGTSTQEGWRPALEQGVTFLRFIRDDPLQWLAFEFIAAIYIAISMALSMSDAWHRG